MHENYRQIIVYVMNQLLTGSNVIVQAGSQWKLARPIQGLESIQNRTFNTKEALFDALADFYVTTASSGNVVGLKFDLNEQATPIRKAV